MNLQFKKRQGVKPQEFLARISNYEIRLDHVYYTILILSTQNSGVKVNHKRYSDLRRIHDRISQIVNHMKLPYSIPCFPGRRLFSKTNNSPENIYSRMVELSDYLNALLLNPNIYEIPSLQELLPDEQLCEDNLKSLQPEIKQVNNEDEYDRDKCWSEMNNLKRTFLDKQDQMVAIKQGHQQQFCFEIEQCHEQGEAVMYSVVIRDLQTHDRWIYKTRYSDLLNFHNALLKEKLDVSLPHFPKRRIFTITNEHDSLIEARRQHLEIYLDQLFQIPEVQINDIATYFLNQTKRNYKKEQSDHQDQLIRMKRTAASSTSVGENGSQQSAKNNMLSLIQEHDEVDTSQASLIF